MSWKEDGIFGVVNVVFFGVVAVILVGVTLIVLSDKDVSPPRRCLRQTCSDTMILTGFDPNNVPLYAPSQDCHCDEYEPLKTDGAP